MNKSRPIHCAAAVLFLLVGGCAAASGPTASPLNAGDQPATPHYDIDLTFEPGAERWSATVRATQLGCQGGVLRVYLHRDIVISEARVDQRSVTPVLDPPGADRFWIKAARAVDLPCPAQSLTLTYSGPSKLHEDGRNQVTAELIELSVYGAWYPLTSVEDRFSWTLTTQLPPDWTYTSPARTEERLEKAGRSLRLVSREPADVVLIASPHFDVATVMEAGAAARVFVNKRLGDAQLATARSLGRDGADMTAWLQDHLGPARREETIRPDIVFTLRGGPLSYARLPVIVLREEALTTPAERSERLNIRHEVAHFWSAARGDQNEWINEGLAEYLAVVRTGDVEGKAVRAKIIADYRALAVKAGTGEPFATAGNDERGFVNRYVRPTLMLDAAESRAGRSAMQAFLRRLFAAGEKLDADRFARAAFETLGDAEGGIITRCLNARDWPPECGGQ